MGAGGTLTLTDTDNGINDDSGAGYIAAVNTNLTANGAIDFESTSNSMHNITATSTGTSGAENITLVDSGLVFAVPNDVTLTSLDTSANNGSISVTNLATSLVLNGAVKAGSGTVTLNAIHGSINDNSGVGSIVAAITNLTAGTDSTDTGSYIDLENSNNKFGTLSLTSYADSADTLVDASTTLTLSGESTLSDLTISTTGDMVTTQELGVGGNLSLSANGSIALDSLVDPTGNLTLDAAGGDISETGGALVIGGTSNIQASGAISLTNASNDFGNNAVTLSAGGAAQITDANATGLTLGTVSSAALTGIASNALTVGNTITATGDVSLKANKTATNTGALTVSAAINAGSNAVTLNNNSTAIASATNAISLTSGTLTAGALNLTTSSGKINQSGGHIAASGTTTITNTNATNLSAATNDFATVAGSGTLGNTTIDDANSLILGALSASGLTVVTGNGGNVNGALTQSGALTLAGASSFTNDSTSSTAGYADITLTNASNDFGHQGVTLSGHNISLADNNATGLILGVSTVTSAINATGDINVTAAKALSLQNIVETSKASGAINLTAGSTSALTQDESDSSHFGEIENSSTNLIAVSLSAGSMAQAHGLIATNGGSLNISGGASGITLTSSHLSGNDLGTLTGSNLQGNVSVLNNAASTFNIGNIAFTSSGALTLQTQGAAASLTQTTGTTITTQNSSVSLTSNNGGINQNGTITTNGGSVNFQLADAGAVTQNASTGGINTATSGPSPTYGVVSVKNSKTGTISLTTTLNATGNNFLKLALQNTTGNGGTNNQATALTVNDLQALEFGQDYTSATARADTLSSLNIDTSAGNGTVTQSTSAVAGTLEALKVTGTATVNAGSGNITLTRTTNDFNHQAVSLTGNNLSLTDNDSTSLVLGTIAASGTASFTAQAGTITDGGGHTGSITAATATSLTAHGKIDLENTSNSMHNITASSTTGAIILVDSGEVSSVATPLTITSLTTNNGSGTISVTDLGSSLVLAGAVSADSGSRAVTLTADGGSIADGAGHTGTIAGISTTLTADGAIDLENAANEMSSITASTTGTSSAQNITLVDSGEQGGSASNLLLSNLNTSANNSNISVTDLNTSSGGTSPLVIDGAVNAGSGTVTLTVNHGAITDNVGVGSIVAATTNLTAGSSSADTNSYIDLENTSNSLGTLTATAYGTDAIDSSTNSITVIDGNTSGLILGNLAADGDLSVTASGNITQATGTTIDMTSGTAGASAVDFDIASGHTGDINLVNNNDFNQNAVVFGGAGTIGNVTLKDVDASGLVLGASTIGGELDVTSSGAVTQSGALTVAGTTTVDAGTSNITLTNAGNDFGNQTVELTGKVISLTDSDTSGLTLGAVTASGTTTFSAKSIDVEDDLNVGAHTLNLTTTNAGITSGNNAIHFDNGTVTAGNLNLTTASGRIYEDTGLINSSGTMTIAASDGVSDGGNAADLSNADNLFGTVNVTSAGDVSLYGKNGYIISGITSTGNIYAETNYGIGGATTGTLEVSGAVTTTKANGSIHLSNTKSDVAYGLKIDNTGSLSASGDINVSTSQSESSLTHNGIDVEGSISSTGGNIYIYDNRNYALPGSAYAANMNITGSITTNTGSLELEDFGAGTITIGAGANLDGGSANTLTIQSDNGSISQIAGNITSSDANTANTGVSITSTDGNITQNGTITTSGSQVYMSSNGDFSQNGTITAGSGSTWGNVSLVANGVAGGSTGVFTQAGTIEGNDLSLIASADDGATGTLLQNGTLISHDLTNQNIGVGLYNGQALVITQGQAGTITTTGSRVALDDSLVASGESITQAGSINTDGGDVQLFLTGTGTITQNSTGSITAKQVESFLTTNANIVLNGTSNTYSALAIVNLSGTTTPISTSVNAKDQGNLAFGLFYNNGSPAPSPGDSLSSLVLNTNGNINHLTSDDDGDIPELTIVSGQASLTGNIISLQIYSPESDASNFSNSSNLTQDVVKSIYSPPTMNLPYINSLHLQWVDGDSQSSNNDPEVEQAFQSLGA